MPSLFNHEDALFQLYLEVQRNARRATEEFARDAADGEPVEEDISFAPLMSSLAVVGVQSAGKTSLLTRLAGFPLGVTSSGCGTRCPVRNTLIHDETLPEGQLVVTITEHGYSPRTVDVRDLPVESERIMSRIKETSADGFSDVELLVEVRGRELSNFTIVDLPGLRPNTPEVNAVERDAIARLVAKFVRNRNNSLIVVASWEYFESNTALELVTNVMMDTSIPCDQPTRPDWADSATVVFTKAGQLLTNPSTLPEAMLHELELPTATADSGRPPFANAFFVELTPSDAGSVLGLMDDSHRVASRFADVRAELRRFPELERTWMEQRLAQISGHAALADNPNREAIMGRLRRKLQQCFSIQHVAAHLTAAWHSKLVHEMKDIQRTVADMHARLARQLAALNGIMILADPVKSGRLMSSYCESFATHLRALVSGRPVDNVHYAATHQAIRASRERQRTSAWPSHNASMLSLARRTCLKARGPARSVAGYDTATDAETLTDAGDSVMDMDLAVPEGVTCAEDLFDDTLHDNDRRLLVSSKTFEYLASVHGGTLEEDMTAAETMHPFATHKAEPAGGHSASNAGDSSHAYFRHRRSKMIGEASFERLFNECMLTALSNQPDRISTADILQKLKDYNTGVVNEGVAVVHMARLLLKKSSMDLDMLRNTLMGLFMSYTKTVTRIMLGGPRYRALALTSFPSIVEEWAFHGLQERLDTEFGRIQQVMQDMMDDIQVDLPAKFLMGYMSTPLRPELVPKPTDYLGDDYDDLRSGPSEPSQDSATSSRRVWRGKGKTSDEQKRGDGEDRSAASGRQVEGVDYGEGSVREVHERYMNGERVHIRRQYE